MTFIKLMLRILWIAKCNIILLAKKEKNVATTTSTNMLKEHNYKIYYNGGNGILERGAFILDFCSLVRSLFDSLLITPQRPKVR